MAMNSVVENLWRYYRKVATKVESVDEELKYAIRTTKGRQMRQDSEGWRVSGLQ